MVNSFRSSFVEGHFHDDSVIGRQPEGQNESDLSAVLRGICGMHESAIESSRLIGEAGDIVLIEHGGVGG